MLSLSLFLFQHSGAVLSLSLSLFQHGGAVLSLSLSLFQHGGAVPAELPEDGGTVAGRDWGEHKGAVQRLHRGRQVLI